MPKLKEENMGIFKKIFRITDHESKKVPPTFYSEGNSLVIYFRCKKCGEKFAAYLRKGYDLITNYDDSQACYFINKEFIGSKCFEKINLLAEFDEKYKIIKLNLTGADILTRQEYEKDD